MRNTFKVMFYLKKSKVDVNGEAMIMTRITVNGEGCQFSTKQKIDLKNWDVKRNCAIGRGPKTQQINNLLEEIKGNLFRVVSLANLPYPHIHTQLSYSF